jgi:hypothetical protein
MWSRRILWAVMIGLYGMVGVVGILVLAPNTFVGADLAVFQQAGDDLLARGNPYASNATAHYNFQYRYPPLLAMVMPVLGWAPLWYALLFASTAAVFYFWYRDAGWFSLLPIVMLAGPWGQPLLNGNVQPILMLLLALVPRFTRAGAVSLATATMLKLHPALGTVWYVGRRDWRGLAWYAGAIGALLIIQAPWMGLFLDYYQSDSDASITLYRGWGLRLAGDVAWIIGAAVTGVVAWRFAPSRYGWMLNLVFQLAALPRLLPTNLALLLSAPLPSRRARRVGQSRTQMDATSSS